MRSALFSEHVIQKGSSYYEVALELSSFFFSIKKYNLDTVPKENGFRVLTTIKCTVVNLSHQTNSLWNYKDFSTSDTCQYPIALSPISALVV